MKATCGLPLPGPSRLTHFLGLATLACLLTAGPALALPKGTTSAEASAPASPKKIAEAGAAEARLIEVYQLISQSKGREALNSAEKLVSDYPHFQLAQLVYGDLLAARIRPIQTLGDVPNNLSTSASPNLGELRNESQMRLKALRERPPPGTVPSEFLSLSSQNKHAIAVDASRSRLYLFENRPTGLVLIADYYISVGKSGTDKTIEGDLRTPLGVYFITSSLDPKALKDFYGSGALPINYPNVLDSKRGKTGHGIWLHGTPPGQFSRPPLSSEGCVVLTNPDLERIIQTVAIRTTPVVISPRLNWVTVAQARATGKPFEEALVSWKNAKSSGNMDRVLSFYSKDFSSNGKTLEQWTSALRTELNQTRGRSLQLKDLSLLRWRDSSDTMIVTFGEVADGTLTGPSKRQYWERQGNQWKIFFEGVI